nr:hypothetical protein [Tanacetum cinerariifolium]
MRFVLDFWIKSITVNGKNAYELKGKFLDDLHKNAFSGTNGDDAVEHIEYFLKIVDPIDLPNVNRVKLKVVVFQSHWLDMHGDGALWDYWKLRSDEVEPTNKKTLNLEETNQEFNYLLKIDSKVLPNDIVGFKTYGEYKDDWIYEWNKNMSWVHEKPWMENRDSELKEEALRNKAIMKGLINEDVESNNEGWKSWDDFEITNGDHNECEYENEHKDDERYELCIIEWVRNLNSRQEQDHDTILANVKERVRLHSTKTRRKLFLEKNDKVRIKANCLGRIPVFTLDGEMPSNTDEVAPTKKTTKVKGKKDVGPSDPVRPNKKGMSLGGKGRPKPLATDECPRALQITKVKSTETWEVRTYTNEHQCLQSRKIHACTSKFLSKGIVEQIEKNTDILVKSLQDEFQNKYELELRRENTDTTIKINVERDSDTNLNKRVFKRIYIYLVPLKKGFKAYGRDLLGLNDAFMKGPYPGKKEPMNTTGTSTSQRFTNIAAGTRKRPSDVGTTPSTAAGTRKMPSNAGTTPSTTPSKKKQATYLQMKLAGLVALVDRFAVLGLSFKATTTAGQPPAAAGHHHTATVGKLFRRNQNDPYLPIYSILHPTLHHAPPPQPPRPSQPATTLTPLPPPPLPSIIFPPSAPSPSPHRTSTTFAASHSRPPYSLSSPAATLLLCGYTIITTMTPHHHHRAKPTFVAAHNRQPLPSPWHSRQPKPPPPETTTTFISFIFRVWIWYMLASLDGTERGYRRTWTW